MLKQYSWRRLVSGLLTGLALLLGGLCLPIVSGALAPAHAQVSVEFRVALQPYGAWRHTARFGEVWVPRDRPHDWRPYEDGHWVYTDEWGWYWISDEDEVDWGWVTYHYGRWAYDPDIGWFWVPGDEWAPAWVNWRYGDDYVGWAPLPPDRLIEVYDEQPDYWIFVAPRFITAPRLRTYIVPAQRVVVVWRDTRVVNRTLRVEHDRVAVNAGLSPAFVAKLTGAPLPTFRVSPHVLAGTQGVRGGIVVRADQLRERRPGGQGSGNRLGVVVERTTTVIQPSATAAAPQPLGKGERGRLGTHPPHAAQAAVPVQQQPAATQKPAVTPPALHTVPQALPAPQHAAPQAPQLPTVPQQVTPKALATPPEQKPSPPAPHVVPPPPAVQHMPAPPAAVHTAPPAHPAPPAIARPAPPPHPAAPMAKPAPPHAQAAGKPGEKREVPK